MRTILIAQRDTAFAEQLTGELRAAGYHVIACPGPCARERTLPV